MMRGRSGWRVLLLWMVLAAAAWSAPLDAQPRTPKPAEDEFVPVDQLPPEEQLPAAPLLIAAYSVAWIAVAGYLFSIWRRLDRVDRDIADAVRRLPRA